MCSRYVPIGRCFFAIYVIVFTLIFTFMCAPAAKFTWPFCYLLLRLWDLGDNHIIVDVSECRYNLD